MRNRSTAHIDRLFTYRPTRAERIQLITDMCAARDTGERATYLRLRARVVEANLRLVAKLAARYVSAAHPIEDLLGFGTLGLIRACEGFDVKRRVQFSTYAYPWVRRFLRRSIDNFGRVVRIPVVACEQRGRLVRARRSEHDASEETLQRTSGLTPQQQRRLDAISFQEPRSLSETASGHDERTLLDTLPADTPSPEELLLARERHEEAWRVLGTLGPVDAALAAPAYAEGAKRIVTVGSEDLNMQPRAARAAQQRVLNMLAARARNV
jgi:RNA polymerase sigma factor (sigma-70 family)